MRIINTGEVVPVIRDLAIKACYELDDKQHNLHNE
jgi:hypothetical protein